MQQSDITTLVRQLNDAWLQQDYDALAALYHPQAVLLPPDAGAPITGRDAVLQTYRDFHSVGSVTRFEVDDITIYEFAASVMCHMRFQISYRVGDNDYVEPGLETYMICEHEGVPVIGWRAQFTL
ncbi:MAG: nuclear transport factor 2 family protein [Pseudomonadota bacterium]